MCHVSRKWNLFWWELPPFVEKVNGTAHAHSYFDKDEGMEPLNVQGLMIDMLVKSMRACCDDGKVTGSFDHDNLTMKLQSSRQFTNQEQMLNNLSMNTVAMPIMMPSSVAATNPTAMFIRMVDNTGMMYIAKHRDEDEVGNVVIEGFINIWPLFLAVVVLTGYIAVFLWLAHLRQYLKTTERVSLIKNYFDWYWCAFITAATIGYGDRVPRNLIGKALMMVWALFGLSLMSIFVATMTTLLTEHRSVISTVGDMKNSRVGVLAGSVERRFVLQDGAKPVEFATASEMLSAVTKGEVDGIALDHYTFHHLYSSNELKDLDYEVTTTPGITVGYVLLGEDRHELLNCLRLQAFLNELNVDSSIMRTFSHTVTGRELRDEAAQALQSTALSIMTTKMRLQLVVLGGIFLCLIACISLIDLYLSHSRRKRDARSNVLVAAKADCPRGDSHLHGKQYAESDITDNMDAASLSRSTPLHRTSNNISSTKPSAYCARCSCLCDE